MNQDSALHSASDALIKGYDRPESPPLAQVMSLEEEAPSDDDFLDLGEESVHVSGRKREQVSTDPCSVCDNPTACICPPVLPCDQQKATLTDAPEPESNAFRICNQAACICPKIPKMSSDFCQSLDHTRADVRARVTIEVTDKDVIASPASDSTSHDVMSYCSVQNLFKEQENEGVHATSPFVRDHKVLRCNISSPSKRSHLNKSCKQPRGYPLVLSSSIEDNEQDMIRALTRTPAFLRDRGGSAASLDKNARGTETMTQTKSSSALCTFRFCRQDRTQLVVQNVLSSVDGYTVQGFNSVASVGSTMSLPQSRDECTVSPLAEPLLSYQERLPSTNSAFLPLQKEKIYANILPLCKEKKSLVSEYEEWKIPASFNIPNACVKQTASDSHTQQVPKCEQFPRANTSRITPNHHLEDNKIHSTAPPSLERRPDFTSYQSEHQRNVSSDKDQPAPQCFEQENHHESRSESVSETSPSQDSSNQAEQAGDTNNGPENKVPSTTKTSSSDELEQNLRLANVAAIHNMTSSCNRYFGWTGNVQPSSARRTAGTGASRAEETTPWTSGCDVRDIEKGQLVELSMSGSGSCSMRPTSAPPISTWVKSGNVRVTMPGLGLGFESSMSGSGYCTMPGPASDPSVSMWTISDDVRNTTPGLRHQSSLSGSGVCGKESTRRLGPTRGPSIAMSTSSGHFSNTTPGLGHQSSMSGSGYCSTGPSIPVWTSDGDVRVTTLGGRPQSSVSGSGYCSTKPSSVPSTFPAYGLRPISPLVPDKEDGTQAGMMMMMTDQGSSSLSEQADVSMSKLTQATSAYTMRVADADFNPRSCGKRRPSASTNFTAATPSRVSSGIKRLLSPWCRYDTSRGRRVSWRRGRKRRKRNRGKTGSGCRNRFRRKVKARDSVGNLSSNRSTQRDSRRVRANYSGIDRSSTHSRKIHYSTANSPSSSYSTQTSGSREKMRYSRTGCSSHHSSQTGSWRVGPEISDRFSSHSIQTCSSGIKATDSCSSHTCSSKVKARFSGSSHSCGSKLKAACRASSHFHGSRIKGRHGIGTHSSVVSSGPGSVCGRSACARRVMDRPSSGDINSSMSCQQGSTSNVGPHTDIGSTRPHAQGANTDPLSHLTITIRLEDGRGRQQKEFTLTSPRPVNANVRPDRKHEHRRPKEQMRTHQRRWRREMFLNQQMHHMKNSGHVRSRHESQLPAGVHDNADILSDAEVLAAQQSSNMHEVCHETSRPSTFEFPHRSCRNIFKGANGVSGVKASVSNGIVRRLLTNNSSNNTAIISSSSSKDSSKVMNHGIRKNKGDIEAKAADKEKHPETIAAFQSQDEENGRNVRFTTSDKASPIKKQNIIMISNFGSKNITSTTTTETMSSLPNMPIFSFHNPVVQRSSNPSPQAIFNSGHSARRNPSSVGPAVNEIRQRQVDATKPSSHSNRSNTKSEGPKARTQNKSSRLPPAGKKQPCVGPFSGRGSSSQKTTSQAESTTNNPNNAYDADTYHSNAPDNGYGKRSSGVGRETNSSPSKRKLRSKRSADCPYNLRERGPKAPKEKTQQPERGSEGGGEGGENEKMDGHHHHQKSTASDDVEGDRVEEEEEEEPVESKSSPAKERLYFRARRLLRQICYLKSKEEILFRAAIRIQHIRLQLQEEHSVLFIKARSQKSFSDRNCNRQWRRPGQKADNTTKTAPGFKVSRSGIDAKSAPWNHLTDDQLPSTSKVQPCARSANEKRTRARASNAFTQDDDKDEDGKTSVLSHDDDEEEEEERAEDAGAADEKDRDEGDDGEEEYDDDEDDDESGSMQSYDDDGDESYDSKLSAGKSKKTDGGDDTTDDDSNDPAVCGFYRQP